MSSIESILEETEELISSIKTLCLRSHLNTTSELQRKLHHLKEFLNDVEGAQDLSNIVDDFIENTGSQLNHGLSGNKLLLKTNIDKLEYEFENFKTKKNLFRYLFGLQNNFATQH